MEPLEDDEESAFGFEFIRDDKKVRAKNLVGMDLWFPRQNSIGDLPKPLEPDLKSMASKA